MYDFFERKKDQFAIELNEVQKNAVLKTEGPLLLLACPGSGKTTTIIMRIGYLIEEKGVQPNRIKAITFSKASALDMTERFKHFFPSTPVVDFSTIHSLAFKIARTYLSKTDTTYELIEGGKGIKVNKSFLLKKIYRDVLHDDCTEDMLSALTTFISVHKNRMIPLSKWLELDEPFREAGQIALKYEQYKTRNSRHILLDFDDMLTIAEQALRTDETLANHFRNQNDYMLTDESQDTSLVQHKIVEHLVAHHGNLCVVADDDQSIYTWRGAEPDYLLDFKSVYPDAHILMMERNYRSSKEIVETTSLFIKKNKKRYNKEMYTENEQSEEIQIKQFEEKKKQLDYVTYELQSEKNLKDIAILFRNNSSSTMFVSELHRRGIPFYMKDADDKFFSHWVVDDILNFMRLSFNTERKDVFAKVCMKMNVFISRNMLTSFENTETNGNVFDAFIDSVDLKSSQKVKLEQYKEVYQKLQDMRPAQVIRIIRYELEYEEALKSRAEKFGYRIDHLMEIMDTLEGIATPLRTMIEFANRLKELESVVQKAKYKPFENAVTLSTFHSAKGLEFKRVFMIDLVNGIIPSKDDLETGELEESRRLFYVAMTRAKKKLELLSYRKVDHKECNDSKFVNEVRGLLLKPSQREESGKKIYMPQADVPYNPNAISSKKEIEVGTEVKHRVFGIGLITKTENEEVTIQFGSSEKRLDIGFVLSKMLLEKV